MQEFFIPSWRIFSKSVIKMKFKDENKTKVSILGSEPSFMAENNLEALD